MSALIPLQQLWPITNIWILPASKACISMRSSDHKAARWIQVEYVVLIQVLLRNGQFYHMILQICNNLIIVHCLIVLSGDENSVNALRNHGTPLIFVLCCTQSEREMQFCTELQRYSVN